MSIRVLEVCLAVLLTQFEVVRCLLRRDDISLSTLDD